MITASRDRTVLAFDRTAPRPGIPRNVTEHTYLVDRAYHVGGMRLPEEIDIFFPYGLPTASGSFRTDLNDIVRTERGKFRRQTPNMGFKSLQ